MFNQILNSFGFGIKIYNRFPLKYREDDEITKFTLRRYLDAIGEGGFRFLIDDWNGLYELVDPNKSTSEGLQILYEQFGLPVFYGIPEPYLRYFLPHIGEAYSAKGSIDVLDFVLASLAGVQVEPEIIIDDNDDTFLILNLLMDESLDGYLPDRDQFIKILKNFVPFYLDFILRLVYYYSESAEFSVEETYRRDDVTEKGSSGASLKKEADSDFSDKVSNAIPDEGMFTNDVRIYQPMLNIIPRVLNHTFILNLYGGESDEHMDIITYTNRDSRGVNIEESGENFSANFAEKDSSEFYCEEEIISPEV